MYVFPTLGLAESQAKKIFSQIRKGAPLHNEWKAAFATGKFFQRNGRLRDGRQHDPEHDLHDGDNEAEVNDRHEDRNLSGCVLSSSKKLTADNVILKSPSPSSVLSDLSLHVSKQNAPSTVITDSDEVSAATALVLLCAESRLSGLSDINIREPKRPKLE